MRAKAGTQIELGELLVIEQDGEGENKKGERGKEQNLQKEKTLLQVYDLLYGSQIAQQHLEMVAGLNLEEGNFSLLDESLRNYQLALLKPLLTLDMQSKTCKKLPNFFSQVRMVRKEDLQFIVTPKYPLFLGQLRSGSKEMGVDLFLPGKEVLSHHLLVAASTGKGKSNLLHCLLWNLVGKQYAGILVLDPHDEYYGRTGLGLKDHPQQEMVSYYTPASPPPGARSLKIQLSLVKPEHFHGAISLSDPQRQCLFVYHKKFREEWISAILEEKKIEGVYFHEDTIAVVKRKLMSLLSIELEQGKVHCTGIFDTIAGGNTVGEICRDVEQGKIVILDTSYFSGALEILVGSLVTHELFEKYKYYKKQGVLEQKPVISIVLEEAPRVLGKQVLEHGSNVFESIAREGRKFQVGLLAITQLPSEIPKNILANMNTKIILGMEMATERQAVIESSPQDLSQDNRNIASLDKGEALVTSTFTRFAVPVRIPLFEEFAKKDIAERREKELPRVYVGIGSG
ncbi:ATP-binding protein [Candidatus Woesearchaeota archaeon]|nr:ATP-binding protein [Candidatus Woesearchaeota archaeon]